jgi:hypothetical protein
MIRAIVENNSPNLTIQLTKRCRGIISDIQ